MAKAQFTVTYTGIDGREVKKFKSLAAVARYLKGQDQGPDYRRPGYLQGEFAQFWFGGFRWSDVMEGNPFDESGKYRPELLSATVRLTWRKKPITSPTSPYAEAWYGYADGEDRGTIYIDKSLDGDNPYHASFGSFGGGNRDAHFDARTLDEAKAWVARLLAAGEEGYYRRRGYWDGILGNRSNHYRTSKYSHLYAEGFDLGERHKSLAVADRPRPEWL